MMALATIPCKPRAAFRIARIASQKTSESVRKNDRTIMSMIRVWHCGDPRTIVLKRGMRVWRSESLRWPRSCEIVLIVDGF